MPFIETRGLAKKNTFATSVGEDSTGQRRTNDTFSFIVAKSRISADFVVVDSHKNAAMTGI